MSDSAAWGALPRVETVGTPDVLSHIDALLADAVCRDRQVHYALDQDPTPLSREEVAAWVTGAEAEGLMLVRCSVDPRGAGPVRVSLCAMQPTTPGSSA